MHNQPAQLAAFCLEHVICLQVDFAQLRKVTAVRGLVNNQVMLLPHAAAMCLPLPLQGTASVCEKLMRNFPLHVGAFMHASPNVKWEVSHFQLASC